VLWNLVNVNVAAATQMMRIVLPKMEAKKKGAIINLASSAALSPQPLVQVYTATKAYMDFLSEALSYEYSRKGITIQTVSPMYVCTSMVAFSDNLNTPSLLVPSPEAFTAQAVRTLGFASKTTGYWSHSLQTGFMDFFILPKIWLSKILNERFRSEALRRK
jgi:17beta-estradiol 17-dehydrogenase / very-long-chain 3-oxoacyl-CoA reductase